MTKAFIALSVLSLLGLAGCGSSNEETVPPGPTPTVGATTPGGGKITAAPMEGRRPRMASEGPR